MSAMDAADSAAPRTVRTADGWTFSADMSDEAMAEIRGLIAANGLAHDGAAPPESAADRAAAADAAFARMMAAHPTATVVGGARPAADRSDGPERTPEEEAEGAAAFERMVAAHGGAGEMREIMPGVFASAPDAPGE